LIEKKMMSRKQEKKISDRSFEIWWRKKTRRKAKAEKYVKQSKKKTDETNDQPTIPFYCEEKNFNMWQFKNY